MAIENQDTIDFGSRFHETVMKKKGDANQQAAFFLHPNPVIILLHNQKEFVQLGVFTGKIALKVQKQLPIPSNALSKKTGLSSEPLPVS